MAARRFDPVALRNDDNTFRRVHQVKCKGCGATSEVSANTHSGSRAHEDLFKVFARRGWAIGRSSAAQDFCPTCLGGGKEERREEEPMAKAPVAKTTAQVVPLNAAEISSPPREPTFDDRRIIIAALQEHYIDERTGYAPGFTDHRIAADLGVPRKWVEDLRAANFGPVKDNEDVRTLLAEARGMLGEARGIAGKEEEAAQARAAFVARLDNLERRVADIEKAVK
jgi:hypothetical protein